MALIMTKKLVELTKEAELIKKQFEECQNFKRQKGILEDAKIAVDFYEGRQWKKANKNLPFARPTINIIQNMVDEKVASVLNKSWKVNYIVNDDSTMTDKVNKFTEWQMNELDQDSINYTNALDTILKGTAFDYWFWDEEREGQIGVNQGGIEVSSVDIQDIAFANPKDKHIQRQDWIIVRSRETVKRVKELAGDLLTEKEKDSLINSKSLDSIYTKDAEQGDNLFLDVYTKFFRKDGEVYFEKSTDEVIFQEARPLNPFISERELKKVNKKELDEDKENLSPDEPESIYETDKNDSLMKNESTDEMDETEAYFSNSARFKASQYPFTRVVFIERDSCIFGISWVAQLVAPQKNINQLMTVMLLTATKWSNPQLVVKEGALGTQQIDMSKPGGIITDYSPQGNDGIKLLNYGTMPTAHYELAQSLITMLKDVYRTNDILNDGRNTSKGMSGYAMNLISSIQEKPIAQWQQKMARAITEEGRILEMYYKLYYKNKKFSYRRNDAEMLELQSQNQNQNVPQMVTDTFNGREYLETPFNVIVEVGESAKFNEQAFLSLIDSLFLNGTIEKLSPETLRMYIALMPDPLFPHKSEFNMLISQKENGIIAQQNQMIEQLQSAIQQLQAQLQEVGTRQQMTEKAYKDKVDEYNYNLKRLSQQNDYNRDVANNKAEGLRRNLIQQ